MKEFLRYVEQTTDSFAVQAKSPLIKVIHRKVTEVKESKEMEVEYMTLLQRDRENIELGREEGAKLAARVIKLYTKGMSLTDISNTLEMSLDSVKDIIEDYENN